MSPVGQRRAAESRRTSRPPGIARDGYPIINYEYAIVKKQQPSAAEAAAIQKFLTWIVTKGSSATYLAPALFQPLPPRVLAISRKLIGSISG